ncbi:hypothetical protein [Streptomyces syringium]|uniref:hypothetical protein n=1 Tax=Streptomyces syringium TaxID=76729 RepID=UPI0037D429E8
MSVMHGTPYRLGAWLVDTQRGKVGQVMGHEGPRVQLRPAGGGCEWEVPPNELRPASVDERSQAGLFKAPQHEERS